MGQYATSYGVNQYRTDEGHQAIIGRMTPRDGTRRGIVFCHGVSQTARGWAGIPTGDKVRALANAGYIVISADLSAAVYAGANWANDDHIDAIGDAVAYARSAFGASADPVGLLGSSMGAAGALAYAKANLADVFAVAGMIPVLSLNDLYAQAAFTAQFGVAYGIVPPAALSTSAQAPMSDHDPVLFGASDLAGLPLGLWAGPADVIAATYAEAVAWNGGGASKTVTSIAGNHDAGQVNPQQVVQFFDDAGGRT